MSHRKFDGGGNEKRFFLFTHGVRFVSVVVPLICKTISFVLFTVVTVSYFWFDARSEPNNFWVRCTPFVSIFFWFIL